MKLSYQELRDIIAWDVAAAYSAEIQNLEKRLSDLKVKHQPSSQPAAACLINSTS